MKNWKQRNKFALESKADVFQSPHASYKNAFHQVNGETEANQHTLITQVQTRKRVPYQ
ncbi:hypothetical protein JOD43_004381 [Pullulanibacillus pueri]|uniref:YpzG family protein n=1 Tax=Pullulanibacillus pueri TaxID=1437324 RepID=A0A8J3A093_9BACL|nr:YpzG family protein [Pullulanibacillus pueri]MBM7684168.1 hypothetical protein [Pullulanibacillus pueri]GGH88838.1 hypothetical protein GCM10007096_42080 [Pullulanibacillus pueri]